MFCTFEGVCLRSLLDQLKLTGKPWPRVTSTTHIIYIIYNIRVLYMLIQLFSKGAQGHASHRKTVWEILND